MAKSGVERQVAGPRRRRRARGRSVVGTLLIGFVLVASIVIWRRTYGVALSRELTEIDRRRVQLESERARLRGELRDESSRSELAPALERLGMRVPSDEQVRILSR